MADNNSKYGFRYYSNLSGGGMPPAIEFPIATAYGTTVSATNVGLSIGDPVELHTDGTVRLAGDASDDPGLFWGVIAGFSNAKVDANGKSRPASYLPNGTTYTTDANQSRVLVIPFGRCIWEVDVDDKVTATTKAAYQALVGENTPLIYVLDVSNPDRPRAGPHIDISTQGSGTDHFRIVGISKTAENRDFSGSNVKMLVMVNEGGEPSFTATGKA